MKARVKISGLTIEAEVESEDPAVTEYCQRLIENASERIEAAIAEALTREFKTILPMLNCRVVTGDEDEC